MTSRIPQSPYLKSAIVCTNFDEPMPEALQNPQKLSVMDVLSSLKSDARILLAG
jgi:hypothetical protein